MIYIAYLPKSKDELLENRKVNKILEWYATTFKDNEFSIIASPGYLSTSESTAKKFINGLSKILKTDYNKVKLGFLNGMNGHVPDKLGNIHIDNHYNNLSTYNFESIELENNKKLDHRKMICFFKTSSEFTDKIINSKNLERFLSETEVYAVLIGSSNQSYTTYFENKAKKGEADVFIFREPDSTIPFSLEDKLTDKNITNDFNELRDLFKEAVITKSFFGEGHTKTQEYLNNILREILKSGLKE